MKFLLLLILILVPAQVYAWPGTVVSVHDGDSIRVRRADSTVVPIRVYGIDCPELGQPHGDAARDLTSALLLGKAVEVVPTGQRPSYGREVAGIVLLDQLVVLQDALVSSGLAWVDGRYCKATVCDYWRMHQQDAKTAFRGLWAEESPIAPWTWRRSRTLEKNK